MDHQVPQPTLDTFRARMSPDSTLGDYWAAPSGAGNQAYQWSDKPHRLLYDLIGEVLHLRAEIELLRPFLRPGNWSINPERTPQ